MPRTRTRQAASPKVGNASAARVGLPPLACASLPPLLLWESGENHCKVQSRELEATRRIMESGKARLTSRAMKGGHLTVWEYQGDTKATKGWLKSLGLKAHK